jgi:Glycosyl hydrolase family 92/F5/8 type C domain/Chitobiase/beta-hexosaminidase C-terminal domain
MSAWFILSSMGIYQPTPGSGLFALGTPLFDEINIHLENGNTFSIIAKNRSAENFYVNKTILNGKDYPATFIQYSDLEKGGELIFEMDNKPNKSRGTKEEEMPHSSVDDKGFLAVPYFDMATNKFKTSLPVILKHPDKNALIYYSIHSDGKEESSFVQYTKPFTIHSNSELRFFARKGSLKSAVITQKFYKVPSDKAIKVLSAVHPMFTAGGMDALIDGITGTANWKTGEWQSYYDKDFEAVIDLEKVRPVSYVGIHVLQDVSPWIVFPREVIFEKSNDGITFQPVETVVNQISTDEKGPVLQQLGHDVKINARFIRVKAKTGGPLPAWHESAGSPTHIFIDEVIVK